MNCISGSPLGFRGARVGKEEEEFIYWFSSWIDQSLSPKGTNSPTLEFNSCILPGCTCVGLGTEWTPEQWPHGSPATRSKGLAE